MKLSKKNSTFLLTVALSFSVLFSSSLLAQPTAQGNNFSNQERINIVEFDKQSTLIQENFKKMQEQMDVIRTTQDPKVQEKLLEEHLAAMQTNSNLMGAMWGPGMMGCCGGPSFRMGRGHMMGWGGMGGYYSKLTPEELKQRQYMTDQYMDMQQNMMNQMMQQNYMWMHPKR